MSGFVGAQHEFHDAAFVQGWADRFVPTPPRIALFDLILERVSAPGLPNAHVLELGLGPGYMARHILERNHAITYEGLDFSEVFFDVARKTIADLMPRVKLTKADLMDQSWPRSSVPSARRHSLDLGPARSWQPAGGRGRVCPLPRSFSGGRRSFEWRLHQTGWDVLDLRARSIRSWPASRTPWQAGFKEPASLALFEHNLDHPTSAQNYACLIAVK